MQNSTRRWAALWVIAFAQFVVIMDTSIVGVVVPKIRVDLGFNPEALQWVFNAFVVAFGGLLLLGGRLSDLFGARRMFTGGWLRLLAGSVVSAVAANRNFEISCDSSAISVLPSAVVVDAQPPPEVLAPTSFDGSRNYLKR